MTAVASGWHWSTRWHILHDNFWPLQTCMLTHKQCVLVGSSLITDCSLMYTQIHSAKHVSAEGCELSLADGASFVREENIFPHTKELLFKVKCVMRLLLLHIYYQYLCFKILSINATRFLSGFGSFIESLFSYKFYSGCSTLCCNLLLHKACPRDIYM